jgi:hypothetical protein
MILSHHKQSNGFALISSILIMALLVMIAMGMLSLSTNEMRSSQNGKAMAEAQANARMALILAIGQLQQHAGSDMRITAPADILDSSYPPALGVWRSWEGSDHEASGNLKGRPKSPDYGSKKKSVSVSESGRFVYWLVSGADENSLPDDVPTLIQKTASTGTVPLLASGTLAESDTRQVHVVPQKIGLNGGMAWWISGDNQKARIPKPYDESDSTLADWSDRNRSHAEPDTEPFNLDRILTDPSLGNKAITRGSADLIANGPKDAITPTQDFHDLTSGSMGLLTNVATGGWRKDLSLLTEKWEEQPTSGLKFFNISPSESLQYTRPANSTDYKPSNSMMYHWADYRDSNVEGYFVERGSAASWAYLQDYATLYKIMTSSASRVSDIQFRSWIKKYATNARQFFHKVRLTPQIARFQMVVSHYATTEGAAPGKYRPAVLQTSIFTIWNPHNVRITLDQSMYAGLGYQLPIALRHKLGVASDSEDYYASTSNRGSTHKSFHTGSYGWGGNYRFGQGSIILEPGETRIYSPDEGFIREATYNRQSYVPMSPGVRTGVGVYYALDRRLQPGINSGEPTNPEKVSLAGSTSMEVDAKFDVPSSSTGLPAPNQYACGIGFQWLIGGTNGGRNSHGWWQAFYTHSDAEDIYPPVAGLASATLAECADTPKPFLSMILGSRISNHKATATKGMVQANPVVDFFGSSADQRFTEKHQGGDNLINHPWDFSYIEHGSGPADDMLPNADNNTNSSYIVTGVRKAEGLSRIVCSELPTRPLSSLADLTHMQVRGLNPTPPYAFNVVANSDATPLIPKNSVVDLVGNWRAGSRINEQQDDSYCANHILFDDWFFSSIAPEPSGFGPDGGTDLRQNYIDFLTGDDPLANRSYLSIQEDQVTDTTKAGEIYTDEVEPSDSWKKIASRLEVRGMFNVNSTSVKAWRALLGHARNHKIPYTKADGSIALSGDTDYAVSRISVAGDKEAGEPTEDNGYFATTEFGGYRVFTDKMLDFLAGEIVEQVRLRGPFLSLSEFVNRQLSDDTDLALAGAIQTALNELTADSSLNPFSVMQDESVASVGNPPGKDDYVFPEAAVGHNTYGLPGWTRQADILRPLAPILSARDDTFTIRAYGEYRGADGTVIASVWCEATVQRTREFFDHADESDMTALPTQPVNLTYGRRFKIVSFRWLSSDEV